MKLLRSLAGYTLYDHKTNDYIPRTTDYRHTRQDRWIQTELAFTLERMSQNRIPLKSCHYRPQGRITIGRPKKRWREQLYSGDGKDQKVKSLMFMMMIKLNTSCRELFVFGQASVVWIVTPYRYVVWVLVRNITCWLVTTESYLCELCLSYLPHHLIFHTLVLSQRCNQILHCCRILCCVLGYRLMAFRITFIIRGLEFHEKLSWII